MSHLIALRTAATAACALVLAVISPSGIAQEPRYPSRPVTLVVPFAPGGGVDIVARILANGMTPHLGQPMVVENRPGASGSIASKQVARAAADGYSLLLGGANNFVVNQILLKDAQPELPAVGIVGRFSYILVVAANSSVNSTRELIDLARRQGTTLNYGSPGVGSPHHLAMEMLKHQSGAELTHVAYKGAAPALADLVAGHLQAMFIDYPGGIAFLRSGRIKALGIGGRVRSALLPDVPTMIEQGLPDFEVSGWLAIGAPPGLPQPVSAHITRALASTLDDPATLKRFAEVGLEPSPAQTAEQLAQFVKNQRATWEAVIRSQRITSE